MVYIKRSSKVHFYIIIVFFFELNYTIQLCLYRPKPFHFAIVDEVDSVLIDEGRNPLLISGEVIMPSSPKSIASKSQNHQYTNCLASQ